MKSKAITKTITTTLLKAAYISVIDGNVVQTPVEEKVVTYSKVKKETALKVFLRECKDRSVYKHETIVITDIVQSKVCYGMDLEKFMELATIIDDGQSADEWKVSR
jgi:hypothetical protein